jgi:competence protein ComEC
MADPAATWRSKFAISRRPAIAAALFFIAGILAHESLPPRLWTWIILTIALLAIAIAEIRRGPICAICLAMAVFLTGVIRAQADAYFFPRDQIALFSNQADLLCDLEVHITQPPQITGGLAEMRRLPLKQILTGNATAVRANSGWQPVSGRIIVSVEPPLDNLSAGQTIRAAGFLSRPESPQNPGQFDYAQYDRQQGILVNFRVRRSEGIQIIHDDGPPLITRLHSAARRFLTAGFSSDRLIDADFLRLLVLGDTDRQVEDLRNQYNRAGTVYQLSISGIHIAILGGVVLWIARLLRARPRIGVWIALLFIGLYAVIALPSQSGMRSLAICFVATAGLLHRRSSDGFQTLAIAVMAVLLISPADIADAGFQIGVAAVLGLLLFGSHVTLFFDNLRVSDDPWIKSAGENSLFHLLARFAWRILLASSIIWLAVMPLIAYHFQQTNPWSVPAGFILLPFTMVTLLAGILKILFTMVLSPFAATWAAAVDIPTALLERCVNALAHLPGASITTAPPPLWAIALYYALLCIPLIPWQHAAIRRIARCAPILACVLFFLIPSPASALPGETSASSPTTLRISFLSIGAGQTALVRVPGGETFFVDCGSTTIPDVFRRDIQPYLQHEGIRKIDEIYLSHGDYDHICAAEEIIEAYHVPRVRMTPYFRPHAAGNIPAEALLHFLDTTGPAPTLTLQSDQIDVGPSAKIKVLWPPPNCTMDSNNCGMVLKLTYAGRSILFPADIQVPPELALLKQPQLLKSDVLVAPHHGSAESSTLAFIHAIDPRYIIASSDRMLTHKQLVFDELAKPWPVYRTNRCGEIDVTLTGDGRISVNTFSNAAPIGPSNPPH